jgi:predicted DNA-binding transcriptional regulator AlpA
VDDIDAIKVLNRREAVKHLGISERSFQRLEALGDGPPKTRLSKGRVGYRVSDIAVWLDARRETSTARELIDSNWKRVGAAAAALFEKVGRR